MVGKAQRETPLLSETPQNKANGKTTTAIATTLFTPLGSSIQGDLDDTWSPPAITK